MNAMAPDVFAWLATSLRAFYPTRLLLVALAVSLTGLGLIGLEGFYTWQKPDLQAWWEQPYEQVHAFANLVVTDSVRLTVLRSGVLFLFLATLWGPVIGWVARHEVLARYANPYESEQPQFLGPTAMARRAFPHCWKSAPVVLLIVALLHGPLVIAAAIGNLGSIGSIFVALTLPLVLVANLIIFFMVLGLLAWPLQPIALVVEGSDIFDALSRGYNYAFQRPLTFLALLATSIGIAVGPLLGWHYVHPHLNWPALGGPGYWLAVVLGAALFTSLQTLIYLHLRASIDEVDQGTFVANPDSEESTVIVASSAATPPQTPFRNSRSGLATALLLTLAMIGTWWLTYRLYEATCTGESTWLGWGFYDGLVPPAQGLYKVASVFAGFWGFVWVLFPFAQFIRPRRVPEELPPP